MKKVAQKFKIEIKIAQKAENGSKKLKENIKK